LDQINKTGGIHMENQTRRNFLKTMGKAAVAVAAVSAAKPANVAFAEEEKQDYKWKADALPCELIKEVDAKAAGFRSFEYKPDNRAHITNISFDVKLDDKTVHNIEFTGGCDGSTHGVASVAEGKEADFIIERLKGLQCNLIKSGSSCPDQFANAVEQAMNIIEGKACTYCFFLGNISNNPCNA
jgi:uncharacterized protein (TIGR03905 family)